MGARESARTATRTAGATVALLLLGVSLLAIALWLVNFYAIMPIAFPQLSHSKPLPVSMLIGTFLLGTMPGAYILAAGKTHVRDD